MTVFEASLLAEVANQVGESPVWDAASNSLYWVDIPTGQILRRSEDGAIRRWDAPLMIGSIVLAHGRGLIAATEHGFARVALEGDTATLDVFAQVLDGTPGKRFNDGACDREGRFWSGTMRLQPNPETPDGMLYRLGLDGKASPMLDAFLTQNGLAWSPDGRVMYVSDSHPHIRSIWTFEYDRSSGTFSNRRRFAEDMPGRPDGAAMDVDGCYWIAASDTGKILRLTPDGRIDAEIAVPVPNPTNLCFGGQDMRQVFITSLRRGEPGATIGGDLYTAHLPYQGMPETLCRVGNH